MTRHPYPTAKSREGRGRRKEGKRGGDGERREKRKRRGRERRGGEETRVEEGGWELKGGAWGLGTPQESAGSIEVLRGDSKFPKNYFFAESRHSKIRHPGKK